MPDVSVRESKERVRTAIKNSEYELHSKKIIINLSPANTRKEGSYYDLAMAIGILKNLKLIGEFETNDFVFIGELSLNGTLNRVNGILPMCIECRKMNIKNVIIPYGNKEEAGIVDDINIYPAKTLREVIGHLNGEKFIKKYKKDFEEKGINIDEEFVDFKDIKGQKVAKRALEIVAAGSHNCLMIGSPGCGKTMLAKALKGILPELSFEDALETTKIYSIAGTLKEKHPLIKFPVFRAPHYTISKSAFCGGGKYSKPGEIGLANNGVLYLDEIAEFDRHVLECLRTPLEDKEITVSRMNYTIKYPSKFIFLASMNPCPCGYYMDKRHECICSENQISRYINKISGPLLDRVDICLEVSNVEYKDLKKENLNEDSKKIRKRVETARNRQKERYQKYGIQYNSELNKDLIEKFCKLDDKSNQLLEKAYEKYSFNARNVDRVLKVARTIADLDNSTDIRIEHLAEAIQYKVSKRFNRGVI